MDQKRKRFQTRKTLLEADKKLRTKSVWYSIFKELIDFKSENNFLPFSFLLL